MATLRASADAFLPQQKPNLKMRMTLFTMFIFQNAAKKFGVTEFVNSASLGNKSVSEVYM